MTPPPKNQISTTLASLKSAVRSLPLDGTLTHWDSVVEPFRATEPSVLLHVYAFAERSKDDWPYAFSDFKSARRVICHALNAFCADANLARALAAFTEFEPLLAETLAREVSKCGRDWSKDFYRDPSLGALNKDVYVALGPRPYAGYVALDYVRDHIVTGCDSTPWPEFEMAKTLMPNWTGPLDSLIETIYTLVPLDDQARPYRR
jgi:hypothetical protein